MLLKGDIESIERYIKIVMQKNEEGTLADKINPAHSNIGSKLINKFLNNNGMQVNSFYKYKQTRAQSASYIQCSMELHSMECSFNTGL